MNISHILTKKGGDNFSISPDQPLAEAVALMARQRIGSVVVMAGDELKSIVTERDVLIAVGEQGSLDGIKVSDVMAPRLVTCSTETTLDEAMDMMINNETGRRIRHLPVVDGDNYVGIISIGDVVEALLTKTEFENKLLKNYIKNWPDDE